MAQIATFWLSFRGVMIHDPSAKKSAGRNRHVFFLLFLSRIETKISERHRDHEQRILGVGSFWLFQVVCSHVVNRYVAHLLAKKTIFDDAFQTPEPISLTGFGIRWGNLP